MLHTNFPAGWNMLKNSDESLKRKGPPRMDWAKESQILMQMHSHMLVCNKFVFQEEPLKTGEVCCHIFKVSVSLCK